jgi:hypothetical protein
MARPHPRPGRSLARRWLAARVHARQEARRSSPERTALAIAGSRTARTGKARRPGLPGTPRRSRVRTDHTSHSSPAPYRSGAGPRYPARRTLLPCSPLHICFPGARFPARPLVRPSGTTARSGTGSRGAGHRGRGWVAQRSGGRARQARARRATRARSASPPPLIRSGRPPARYKPALTRGPLSTTAGTTSKRARCGHLGRRHPPPGRPSSPAYQADEDAVFVPARRIGPQGSDSTSQVPLETEALRSAASSCGRVLSSRQWGVIRAPAPARLSVRAVSGPAVKSRRDGVSVRGAAP